MTTPVEGQMVSIPGTLHRREFGRWIEHALTVEGRVIQYNNGTPYWGQRIADHTGTCTCGWTFSALTSIEVRNEHLKHLATPAVAHFERKRDGSVWCRDCGVQIDADGWFRFDEVIKHHGCEA